MNDEHKERIKVAFESFNDYLFALGVELDDHAEFCSILRDAKTGEKVATVVGNEIDDWVECGLHLLLK